MSILNHFCVSFVIVPSAIAAWIACVEHRLQLRVVLAHADRDAAAEHVAADARCRRSTMSLNSGFSAVAVRAACAAKIASTRPAARSRSCCSVVLYSRIVIVSFRYFSRKAEFDGRALHADGLALEHRLPGLDRLLGGLGSLSRWTRRPGAGAAWRAGESFIAPQPCGPPRRRCEKLITSSRLSVMFMPAMMASYFWAVERRDDAVPILRDDLAFHLHARAKIVGEVDLEAVELAARAGEVPRRISALGRDLDRFPFLALRGGAADGERGGQQAEADDLDKSHHCSPGCGFVRAFDWRATRQTRCPRRVGQANRQRRRRAQVPTLPITAPFAADSGGAGPGNKKGADQPRPSNRRAVPQLFGVMSSLNHFSESFLTVPSLMAAAIASSNIFFSSVRLAEADADAPAEDAAGEARPDDARSP